MTDVTDHIDTDVRERILVTAERLFREIGYQKTTVADIAKAAADESGERVSLLRFQKVDQCRRRAPADGGGRAGIAGYRCEARSAAERLRELLTTVHRMNSDRYVRDSKMHEMVAVAMEENWDVCKAHIGCINGRSRPSSGQALHPGNSM